MTEQEGASPEAQPEAVAPGQTQPIDASAAPTEAEPAHAPAADGSPAANPAEEIPAVADAPEPDGTVQVEAVGADDAVADPTVADASAADETEHGEPDEATAAAHAAAEAVEVPENTDEVTAEDAHEAAARKEALLVEATAIAETPDVGEDGRAPDDRQLSDRMRAVESVWRRVGSAGPREPELRRKLQDQRSAYATARTRRAEARAVDRARAGELKRALLVEAFTLAQQLDPSVAQPVAPPRRATAAHRPSPAMIARRAPVTTTEEPAEPAPEATETPAVDAPADVAPTTEAVTDAPVAETPAAEPAVEETAAETVEVVDAPDAEVPATEVGADADAEVTVEETAPADTATPTADAAAEPDAAPAEEAPAEAAPAIETSEADLAALARRAQQLQAEWTAAGFAGREVEAEFGPLFRKYLQVVFDRQRQESGKRVAARRELVARAKALAETATSADAGALSAVVRDAKALQGEWKAGAPAPRGPENAAWQRFSAALAEVFSVRRELQGAAKEERSKIVDDVAALANSSEPMRAMRDLGNLLARWRKAAPVPGPVYTELKKKLDDNIAQIRSKADAERARRDAADAKSQQERAKWAARVVGEATRGPKGKQRQESRSSSPAGSSAGGALAAALAAASVGRRDEVSKEVAQLEKTLADLQARLTAAQSGETASSEDRVDTAQGFKVVAGTDRGADNPVRIQTEIDRTTATLERRRSELAELDSSARGLGITTG